MRKSPQRSLDSAKGQVRLGQKSAATTREPAQQQPKPASDPAATLYGPQKPEAKSEPSNDVEAADQLYGSSDEALRATYEPALRQSVEALADQAGVTDPAQRQQMAVNAAEVFSNARLSPQEASKLYCNRPDISVIAGSVG